ncbi:CHRD domain-containing protein [Aquimarina brevivitae]|uniref:Copper/zinc superoxide dismutase (SODC) n=1 Tax=Aquimarina brevivitae TaxID=323412 RepID=A0A4Q7NYR4_9FLAO|nr:CHRD domain-containing protein [Aquimarina brevivitae]RZS92573.1 copper/zinc superoxide dismutase (SODC) [Aquimarina brevivitae]
MKNVFLKFLLIVPLLFIGCSDDDDGATIEATAYTLAEVGGSGVSGTATFTKVNATTTRIDVALEGTPAGGDHPMHIHMNDAATGGGIAITLTNVDGDTGLSTTTVTALDDDTAITYEGLIDYNGYINVHLSANELATIVAQGNIGSNVP